MLVSNIGRAIIKKLAIKFEGNEMMSVDDFDVFACYRDLWKIASEKKNAIRQGIISNDGCTINCMRLRINAGDKNAGVTQDKAIAGAYGNKFIIPLDFEMLDSSAPYYQAGLGNRPCYEITFNDYNRVINSAVASPDAEYKITDISLEYEIVSQPTLARSIKAEYDEKVLLYDRVLRHRQIIVNKSDTTWNWSFNIFVPADKAPNNVIIICKWYYIQTLIKELGLDNCSTPTGNSTYTSCQMSSEDIVNTHDTFMKSLGIELSDDDKKLPYLYWTPKLHKSPVKHRFIAGCSKCTTKEFVN